MKAYQGRIIVKPHVEKKTESGIELPMNQSRYGRGKVIAIGEDITDLNEGDEILHSLAFDEMEVEGEIYRAMIQDDVFAILP